MRLLIFSDSKGKYNGINKEILEKLLSKSCKLIPKPDFIVLGGDNIAGSKTEHELVCQFNNLRNLINKYYSGTPLFPVIGNHEVNNEPEDDIYEKIFSRIYNDMLPNTCLEDYNKTVFYVDYQDVRLIILNSFHFNEIHKIGERQLS